VARIAYLSSDVIVSVQAAQSIESEFSSHLRRYAGRKDKSLVATANGGVPEVKKSKNIPYEKSSLANIHLYRYKLLDITPTLYYQYLPPYEMANSLPSLQLPQFLSPQCPTSTDSQTSP